MYDIPTLIKAAVVIIAAYLITYYRTNTKLRKEVAYWINKAEETYKDVIKSGEKKHNYAVDELYKLVPNYLKPLFTKEVISKMVYRAFEYIDAYAKQQLDKLVDKVVDK